MASALYQQGFLERAEQAFKNALAVDSVCPVCIHRVMLQTLAHVRNDYGNLLKSSGRMRAAKECYTKALTDQPHLAVAWNNLGCVSLDEANGAEAIEYFTRAIYFDPVLECAYTNLVWCED